MADKALADLRVVLVKPRDSRNVGQVCRAMKTMGFSRLALVQAEGIDRNEAAVTAVHARDILETALTCGELEEALRGTILTAGITRRRGRWRKYFSLDPEQLAERIASLSGPCALVFGNESDGLSDGELEHCHVAVHIPSSPAFPSLNLSHAVQLIAYVLFRRLTGSRGLAFQPIGAERLARLVDTIRNSLTELGFFRKGSPEEMGRFWRDILARAALENREAERLERIFHEIRGLGARRGIPSP